MLCPYIKGKIKPDKSLEAAQKRATQMIPSLRYFENPDKLIEQEIININKLKKTKKIRCTNIFPHTDISKFLEKVTFLF